MIAYEDMPILREVAERLTALEATVSTAESCTGGMLGMTLTSRAGSSAYYQGGVVSYSNEIKSTVLHVDRETLATVGAVSPETAIQMAEGVRRKMRTTYSISTTGIAGPGGGTDKKPVGLVYIAVATPTGTKVYEHVFEGDRDAVRQQTTLAGLTHLLYILQLEG